MRIRLWLIGIGLTSLIFLASAEDDKSGKSNSNLTVPQIAGKTLFTLKKCVDCHTLGEKVDGKLTPVRNKRSDEWFSAHVEKESPIVLREETSKRKRRRVLRAEIEAVVAFLYESKPEQTKQIETLSDSISEGAYLAYQSNCMNCHTIAGFGKDVGPELTHVGSKHDKKWFLAKLENPQQFTPDSVMPKFDHLSVEKRGAIADYLLSLIEVK